MALPTSNIDGIVLIRAHLGDFFVPEGSELHTEARETGGQAHSGLPMLTRRLRPGDTVIDLGAGVGMVSVPLQHAVGSQGRVWCFEPAVDRFPLLCWNLALNGVGFLARAVPGATWPRLDAWTDAMGIHRIAAIRVHGSAAASCLVEDGRQTLRTDRPIILYTRPFGADAAAEPAEGLDRELRALGYGFCPSRASDPAITGADSAPAADSLSGSAGGSVLAVPFGRDRDGAGSE